MNLPTSNAIERAVSAGYEAGNLVAKAYWTHSATQNSFLLDPQFWQCLGKAMGYEPAPVASMADQWWQVTWHSFIDHLASGGIADDFFKDL